MGAGQEAALQERKGQAGIEAALAAQQNGSVSRRTIPGLILSNPPPPISMVTGPWTIKSRRGKDGFRGEAWIWKYRIFRRNQGLLVIVSQSRPRVSA